MNRKRPRWLMLGSLSFLLLALTGVARGQGGGWQQEAVRHGWELSYETARRKAEATGKPLMIVLRCVP